MKTVFKRNLLIATTLLLSTTAFAQRNSNATISTDNNGKTVEMSLQNDQLTALTIDGKKIPENDWKNYSELISTTMAKVKTDNASAKRDRERASQDRIQATRDRETALADRKSAAGDLQRAKEDRARATTDQARATRDRERATLDRVRATKDRERATEERKMISSLTADLVADHVIKNTERLYDLEITETGITVNNVKQPDALFKKYSNKYGSFTGRKFNYTFHQEHN